MSRPITTSGEQTHSFDTDQPSFRASLARSLDRRTLPYLGIATSVGISGAFAVAAFIFVVDWLAGNPLSTPNVLGASLLLGEQIGFESPIRLGVVFGYSLVHAVAFVIAASAAVSTEAVLSARGVPLGRQAVLGAVAMFVGLQTLFGTILALTGGPASAEFGWIRIAGGNALAAATMATLLYVRKREIRAVAKGEIE